MAQHVLDQSGPHKGAPGSRHPNDILLFRAFSQLPPVLAESTAYSAASSAATSPAASRHHSRSASAHGLSTLEPFSAIDRSRSGSVEDLASLHVGLQMPTVSSVGSHSPLVHSQRASQSPVSTPRQPDHRQAARAVLEGGAMTSIAEDTAESVETKGGRKGKDPGMRIDVKSSNGHASNEHSNGSNVQPVSMEAYSDLALTNIAFAESIQRSAMLRGIAFEVHQAIYDGRFNAFLQSQRRQIHRSQGLKAESGPPSGKSAIDEAELMYVTSQYYDVNAVFENPFVLVQTPDLIATQFKALFRFAERTGSELVDVTESEGYGGTHLIVMDHVMHLEIPVGPSWVWHKQQSADIQIENPDATGRARGWNHYRPSRIAKRFLQRRGLWNSDDGDRAEEAAGARPRINQKEGSSLQDSHSLPGTEGVWDAAPHEAPGYFSVESSSDAARSQATTNQFASGYPFETPKLTPGPSPWHTPGRRSSIRGLSDSIESHLRRAGGFTPLKPPHTPGGDSDPGGGVLSTAIFGPSSSVGPGLRFRSSSIEIPPGEESPSPSADRTMTTQRTLGDDAVAVASAPHVHFKIRLMTRILFNEQGKICHHEDVWGIRDVIEGLVPIGGWLYTYLGRKANGWLIGRLMGWPGHSGDK